MCAARCALPLRSGCCGSIPVGKVSVNEAECESQLDAAADSGAVSTTQMLPSLVIQMTRSAVASKLRVFWVCFVKKVETRLSKVKSVVWKSWWKTSLF